MVKNIKKTFKYFIIIAGIIILFPTMLSLVLRIPAVQTILVKRITDHFSEEIKSAISIGSIEYKFFNIINMENFLIRDQNNDTMIFCAKVSAVIRNLDFKTKSFSLGHVGLTGPVLAIVTDSTGTTNLKWFLKTIQGKDKAPGSAKSVLKIGQIDITSGRLNLINLIPKKTTPGIDFNNLRLTALTGTVRDLSIKNDTTALNLDGIAFREDGGFLVRRLNTDITVTNNYLAFRSAILNSDSSVLNISHAVILGDSVTSFSNFIQDVKLDLQLNRSVISTSDLQYFVPAIKGLNKLAEVSGKITGTIQELRGRDIKLAYGNNTVLNCDFDISGLPEIENSFIYLGINNLRTTAKDISGIGLPGMDSIRIPEFLYNLGPVTFNGTFTGFTTDFVAYGKLRTRYGMISTDISFRPEESDRFKLKGLLTGSSIALGEITGKPDFLGNISFRTNVDGYAWSLKKFTCDITGLVDSIEINKYKYRNISLNGVVSDKAWDGNIKINEKNIRLDLLGMFDFRGELPEVDFTLNLAKANLYKLNVDKTDTSSSISMLLTSNFKGSNIDNLDGEIRLLNSTLRRNGKTLDLYDVSVKTFIEGGLPAIDVRTDFLDADLRGYYNFTGLGSLVKRTISTLVPNGPPPPPMSSGARMNNFTFNIRFKNTDRINNYFGTGILLSEKSYLNGGVFTDSIMTIKGQAKNLSIKGGSLADLDLSGKFESDVLSITLTSSMLTLPGQSELKGFSAGLNSKPDNFVFTLDWDNKDADLKKGNIVARGTFTRNENPEGKPVLKIDLDSTDIFNRGSVWNISKSSIVLDSNSLNINRLFISNKDRYYEIAGTVSEDPADTLKLAFRKIDVSPLNYLIMRKDQAGQIPLSIKGEMNGVVLLTDFYRNFLFESNLQVNNFSMLESDYGNLIIKSEWDPDRKVVAIHAGNDLNGKKMLDITGFYEPRSKMVNLTGIADNLPVDALNPLLKVFASGITGTASGRVNLSGQADQLIMKGALMVENASMKIDYLQTKYRINDSIRFDKNNIIFRNVKVTDERGNVATLNGTVFHKYFKDYGANLTINTNESMVLNTKPKDNELFYGTAFATGVTTIKSGPSTLSFDISATSGRNTKISIPLNSRETVSEYPFISFVNKDSTVKEEAEARQAAPASTTIQGMDLNMDLDITPDAEVKLIFDEKVGDEITGTGSGNLNIRLDQKGNFSIYGDYTIEDGTYLFTLKNILNKKFNIESGGKILFNGDINNAEIDMKASYTANALLSTILGPDGRYNERTDVECQINLSGKLFNPVVKLDIYLPRADESTRTMVRNSITTEEELNRQFLYLLVMNSFYSDNAANTNNPNSTTQTGTSAMAVTTTEMISNQLSNWLSQISNDFDLGVNYRPGNVTDINSSEVELAFRTQLLNDRVTINGNFDVRGNSASNNAENLTGDFDIEYTLTEKIRFKVFNRFNNPYEGKQSDYTQGVGIFYKQDFNKFSDLFRKRPKSDMKKEENAVLPEQQ